MGSLQPWGKGAVWAFTLWHRTPGDLTVDVRNRHTAGFGVVISPTPNLFPERDEGEER